MTLARYRPAMTRRLIPVLLATLLLGAGAVHADGRELSAAQKEELEKLRRDKWDEGCSDEEIDAACARRREEMLKGVDAPKGPDPKVLDRDFQDVLSVLQDLAKEGLVPRRAAKEAQGRLQDEWNRAGRMSPSEQATLLKRLRFRVGLGMLCAWFRGSEQPGVLKDFLREMNDLVNKGKSEGLGGEDLLDAVSSRYPKIEMIFDLFDPRDPFLEEFRPDAKEAAAGEPRNGKDGPAQDGKEPPKDETPELSDEEVEEIVDELLLDEDLGR